MSCKFSFSMPSIKTRYSTTKFHMKGNSKEKNSSLEKFKFVDVVGRLRMDVPWRLDDRVGEAAVLGDRPVWLGARRIVMGSDKAKGRES